VRALALLLLFATEPRDRPLWTAPGANFLGAPTRDGRFLTCVDPASGDLALLEVATGKLRQVTRNRKGSSEFAYFSVPSRDGQRVAYAWFNEKGFYDLRSIPVEGGEPRILFRNEESGFVQPSAWTPDGRHILTLFFRKDNISQIALVDAESGGVRVLKSLNWVYPKKMDISRDGKWIVYDSFTGDKPGPRNLYLLALDGSAERKLTEGADDVFPMFSPDGGAVVFTRNGALAAVEVGSREVRLIRPDTGRILPMGLTRDGTLIHGRRSGASEIVFSGMGKLETRTPGMNLAPAWSRDGKQVAYLSLRGAENFGTPSRVVVIRDLEGRTERDLETRMAHIEWLKWSPDGEWLLAAGSDGRGRAGLFRIRTKDGLTRNAFVEDGSDFRGIAGDWTGAGEPARAPDGVIAMAGGATATSDAVRSGEASWKIAGVTWLAWGGKRLFAAQGGRVVELSGDGVKPVALEDYDGGPFNVSPDGNTIVYASGRVRNEVWSMERILAPVDRSH